MKWKKVPHGQIVLGGDPRGFWMKLDGRILFNPAVNPITIGWIELSPDGFDPQGDFEEIVVHYVPDRQQKPEKDWLKEELGL